MRRFLMMGTSMALAFMLATAAFAVPHPTGWADEENLWDIYEQLYPGHLASVDQAGLQALQQDPSEVFNVLTSTGAPVDVEVRYASAAMTFGYYHPTGAVGNEVEMGQIAGGKGNRFGFNPAVNWTGPDTIPYGSNPFGFYITADGQPWYSEAGLNPSGFQALLVYSTPNAGEYLFAWEDSGPGTAGFSDLDYNDLVFSMRNIEVVPEPTSMVLLGMGLAGVAARRFWKKA